MCIFAPMKTNFNLHPYNSFGFHAVAKYFVEINDIQELEALIRSDIFKKEEHLILSGGNNILFQKERFDGIVVRINMKGIDIITTNDPELLIKINNNK